MKLFGCKDKYELFPCKYKIGNFCEDHFCTGHIDDVYMCVELQVPAIEVTV